MANWGVKQSSGEIAKLAAPASPVPTPRNTEEVVQTYANETIADIDNNLMGKISIATYNPHYSSIVGALV